MEEFVFFHEGGNICLRGGGLKLNHIVRRNVRQLSKVSPYGHGLAVIRHRGRILERVLEPLHLVPHLLRRRPAELGEHLSGCRNMMLFQAPEFCIS